MFRTLAQQVEALQGGTTPGSVPPENAATTVMDVEDLKNKVTRLIEQVDRITEIWIFLLRRYRRLIL